MPCKWAGTPNKGSGLRAADGTISEYQHAGLPVQDFRIPVTLWFTVAGSPLA